MGKRHMHRVPSCRSYPGKILGTDVCGDLRQAAPALSFFQEHALTYGHVLVVWQSQCVKPLLLPLLWRSEITDLWCEHPDMWGSMTPHHIKQQLNQSASPTPHTHSSIETWPINNLTMVSNCSREIKSMSPTLNQTLGREGRSAESWDRFRAKITVTNCQ